MIEFINEIGNRITIDVICGAADELCFFSIIGPNSSIESYVTRKELQRLGDSINSALTTHPSPELTPRRPRTRHDD